MTTWFCGKSLQQTILVNHQWRHELDHDTESVQVFWLMLYWAVGVQPGNGSEATSAGIWGDLTGPVNSRSDLLNSGLQDTTHSASSYRPLGSLLVLVGCPQ
jgi:hypothetical protein